MPTFLKWALIFGVLFVWGLFDLTPTLGTCQKVQQEKSEQGAEKGCGFAKSLTGRAFITTTEWIDSRHDFVTAAATLVVAFFTFTLWRATDKLWKAGERQFIAANDAAKIADRNFRVAQRAIVSLSHIDQGTNSAVGGGPITHFIFIGNFKNSGLTPAVDFRLTRIFRVIRSPDLTVDPFDQRVIFIEAPPPANRPHLPVIPGVTVKSEFVSIPWQTAVDMHERRARLYILYRFWYEDIFGDSHALDYCFRVDAAGDPNTFGRPGVTVFTYPAHVNFEIRQQGDQNTVANAER
jgi:hypothetical protein